MKAINSLRSRRKIKVGIVAENYFPTLGGIQEHIRHLRNYLRSQDVEVTILTGLPPGHCQDPLPADADAHVVRVGKSRRYGTGGTYTQATMGPGVWWNMKKALAAGAFDVLNIHGPCDFGLPFFALRQFKGPKVLTLHSCFPDSRARHWMSPYYRWVFKQAAAVIAVSHSTESAMRRYAQFSAQVVPNGVDVRYWRNGRARTKYCQPGLRNIVYLGRMEHRNGPDIALDALELILQKVPNVRLLMAGDGPDYNRLKARLQPRLSERVEFLGAVYDERADIFASSCLFLLPARAVGFSIMVLEAFAAGLPVVALPALGVSHAGSHWKNVRIADDESCQGLANAAVEVLTTNQSQRIALGKRIAEAYDWTKVGPRILNVFDRVTERSSVASEIEACASPRVMP